MLRATIANPDDALLKMDLAAGHFSAADRYRYLRELAFDYAWLLEKLNVLDLAGAAASSPAQLAAVESPAAQPTARRVNKDPFTGMISID